MLEHTMKKLTDAAQKTYKTRKERAAMRCALGDAAALCDAISGAVETTFQNKRGYIRKEGRVLAAQAKQCGDLIWKMRDGIDLSKP